MMEWITLVAIIAVIVYGIAIYNYLVRDRQRTRAGWSPFEGMTFPGSLEAVFIRGERIS